MAAKVFAVVCCFAIINAATSQVIRGPGLPLGVSLPVQETILPAPFVPPVFVNPIAPTYVPNFPLAPNYVVDVDTVLTAPVSVPATTTIIQDSTVANNLANALQLLIVSNLLSNTLPYMGSPDAYIPGYGAVDLVSPSVLPALPPGYTYVY